MQDGSPLRLGESASASWSSAERRFLAAYDQDAFGAAGLLEIPSRHVLSQVAVDRPVPDLGHVVLGVAAQGRHVAVGDRRSALRMLRSVDGPPSCLSAWTTLGRRRPDVH